ncbi:EAL domain-containing protein [Oceanibium sediminis]|uniref:EAL domain-containing protein n=1 Tax=Oceanibium sediminis TaxID=2026339 RepID=UPI0018E4F5D2|nr:EAL domain-containing protein [Oceanibium sediminis]
MHIDSLITDIGSYANEAIAIAEATPSDGAILTIRWINTAFTELTGHTKETVIGRTAGILTGESTEPRQYERVVANLQAWCTFKAELQLYRRSGISFWAALSFQPIRDEGGVVRYWIMQLHDISARKKSENTLADMQLIARATGDMVFVLDRQRRITWVNYAFEEQTGYTLDEARGQRVCHMIKAPSVPQEDMDALARKLDRRLPHTAEILSRRKNGSLFYGEYVFQPTYDDFGRFTKYVLLVRDITARYTLEQRYKAVFDETNAAICIKSGGHYLLVNRRYADLFRRSPKDFVNAPADLLAGSDLDEVIHAAETRVLATGVPEVWEASITDEDGAALHLLTKTFRSFDKILDTHIVYSVSTDITRIRQTERALSAEQEKSMLAQKRLWSAIEGIPDGFVLYDEHDRVVHANRAFRDMHGAIGAQIRTGTTFEGILRLGLEAGLWNTDTLSDEEWLAARLDERETGRMSQGTYLGLVDGGWMLAKEIRLAHGEKAGIRIDATEIKASESALMAAQRDAEKAEARLFAAISALENSFTIYDSDDRIVLTNVQHFDEPVGASKGMSFTELIESAVAQGKIEIPPDTDPEEWIEARKRQHADPGEPQIQTLSNGRTYRVIERKTDHGDTVSMRFDLTREMEQQARLESYARDLEVSKLMMEGRNADLERARRSLEYASRHDSLTGLPNRRFLDYELLRRASNRATGSFAVLHIDLDRFKQINDAFGHAAGDHVLNTAATVLRDETGPADFCARVGGDEFVVLCDTKDDPDRAERLAGDIVASLRRPVRFGANECRFGASIGIAFNDPAKKNDNPGQLLINADIALYRAKGGGRNRWAVFSDSLQAEVLDSKRLSDDILRGLDRGEFTAYYQPQVRADDFSFCGVEALLRWNHPERGLLHPNSFLGVARDLSLLAQLDEIVFAQAAADDAFWRRNGQTIPRIAVNVSDARLRCPDFIRDVTRLGIDPSRLSVELLETIFLDDDDEIMTWTFDQLREMGVAIELDDFGTGHSSIIGLLKLKPARVKIDKSFIDQILGASEAEALLRSIIDIGRNLDVDTVAEGIETLQQAEMLREMGCDVLQGHVFAEAMNAEQILHYARDALVPQLQHQS